MLTDTLIIYQMWSLYGPNSYKYNAMQQNHTPSKFTSNKDSRTIASCLAVLETQVPKKPWSWAALGQGLTCRSPTWELLLLIAWTSILMLLWGEASWRCQPVPLELWKSRCRYKVRQTRVVKYAWDNIVINFSCVQHLFLGSTWR